VDVVWDVLGSELARNASRPSFAQPAYGIGELVLKQASLEEGLHVQVRVPSVGTVSNLERADTVAPTVECLEALPRLTSREPAIRSSDSPTYGPQVVTKAVSNSEREHGKPFKAPDFHCLLDLSTTLGANLPAAKRTLPTGAATENSAEMRAVSRLLLWIVARPAHNLDLRCDATTAAISDSLHADRS
jgi:hypothetical protein